MSMARVLIAGDDERTLNKISFALESRGYDVIYSSDARDAVDTILSSRNNECPVDLFIVDVGMPHMAGVALFLALHDLGKLIPVILVSSLPEMAIPACIRAVNSIQVLTKPIEARTLLRAVERATDERKAHRWHGTCFSRK